MPFASLLVVAAAAPLAHTAATTASTPANRRTTIETPSPCPLPRGRAQGSVNSPIRPVNTLGSMFDEGLAELHTHLGGSVASEILWSLAHEQGIALPVKDYWEFDALVTVSDPRGVANLDALDRIYHWTELIQSSPARGRALRARRDRWRLPLAADHDARAPLQPDEAQPRRRTRSRPHHPRGRPRPRPRPTGVPAGAVRPDPDDGPHVRAPAERDRRREGDPLGLARASSASTSPGLGPAAAGTTTPQIKPMVETAREAGLGITIHVGEEGETGARGDRRGRSSTCGPSGSATGSSRRATRS